MTVKDLIESGLLEAYIADQVSPSERSEVERMAAAHPEVQAVISAIEIALEQMAIAGAVAPPPGLKFKIMDHVSSENAPIAPTKSSPTSKPWFPYIWAVVLGLLAASMYYSQRSQKQQNEAQRIQNETLQQQLKNCTEKNEPVAALLKNKNTRTILLKNEASEALVYYNDTEKITLLEATLATLPPKGHYYQFWAIQNGKPVSLGMARKQGNKYYMTLPHLENVEAFAISLEDKPEGNPQPTKVLVAGKV